MRLVALPPAVEGVTLPNSDGTFDVYINSTMSPERQRRVLDHELRHISRDHFYSERPVEELEREADGLPPVERRLVNVFRDYGPEYIPVFDSLEDLLSYTNALAASVL